MSQVTPTSSTRVLPDTPPSSTRIVALSILDASVGTFGPAAAAWVYDAPEEQGKSSLDPARLKESLSRTLNAYPHWAGQLQYTTYIPGGTHTSRSRRLEVVYGAPTDPGVEFVVASSSTTISDVFPSVEDRTSGLGAFDASTALASHSSGDFMGLPSLIVQVTGFKCGGMVIALKSSHPLADAQTLMTFVNDWSAVNRALVQNVTPPVLSPNFSPAALDEAALGDIDAAEPDPEILKLAHELPVHRYDWWASGEGSPAWAQESIAIPPHLASLTDIKLGPPLPWHEWDMHAPVSNFLLHFSAAELTGIWAAAASPGPPVSRFDALQAHLWAALIRARGTPASASPEEQHQFHFNVTLGVRDRIAPPLPAHTLGSPIVLARASATAGSALPQLARAIRETVSAFTLPRVRALLHEMAFDVDARRMWGGFIGGRNTIVTSWVRLGVYEVDFGAGRPRLVHGVMPGMDGVVQVMEARPQTAGGGPWYQDGASVSVMLPTEVVQRMLKDPLFRKYQ
ncbi:transferase family-domain-containing protein [Mycena olivaceomarginata]|nr:transferase family-domain-containing protein [Mycena olivaceomarginata]